MLFLYAKIIAQKIPASSLLLIRAYGLGGGLGAPAGVGGAGGLRSLPLAVQDEIIMPTIKNITTGLSSFSKLFFILKVF